MEIRDVGCRLPDADAISGWLVGLLLWNAHHHEQRERPYPGCSHGDDLQNKKAAAPVKGRRLSLGRKRPRRAPQTVEPDGLRLRTARGPNYCMFIAPTMMTTVHAMTTNMIRRWGQFIVLLPVEAAHADRRTDSQPNCGRAGGSSRRRCSGRRPDMNCR